MDLGKRQVFVGIYASGAGIIVFLVLAIPAVYHLLSSGELAGRELCMPGRSMKCYEKNCGSHYLRCGKEILEAVPDGMVCYKGALVPAGQINLHSCHADSKIEQTQRELSPESEVSLVQKQINPVQSDVSPAQRDINSAQREISLGEIMISTPQVKTSGCNCNDCSSDLKCECECYTGGASSVYSSENNKYYRNSQVAECCGVTDYVPGGVACSATSAGASSLLSQPQSSSGLLVSQATKLIKSVVEPFTFKVPVVAAIGSVSAQTASGCCYPATPADSLYACCTSVC